MSKRKKFERMTVTFILTILLTSLGLCKKVEVINGKENLSEYHKNVQKVMQECYMNVPPTIKEKFKEYRVIMLNEGQHICDLKGRSKDVNVSASVNHTKKKIWLTYYEDTNHIKIDFYHELAHIICRNNNIKKKDFDFAWIQRYRFFGCFEDIDTEYYTENMEECFSQMYANYKVFPEWTGENFPDIYNFFLELEETV